MCWFDIFLKSGAHIQMTEHYTRPCLEGGRESSLLMFMYFFRILCCEYDSIIASQGLERIRLGDGTSVLFSIQRLLHPVQN